LEGSGTPSR